MIGTRLGPYEVLAKVGEGGMGEVYRARDTRLDREVAIKVLSTHRLDSPDARARFEREAKAVAALSHPNILALYEFGESEGKAFAVTELLDGQSLQGALAEGPLPLRRALDLAAQMAEGLAAAHDKGIVHRDLKPANLFLCRDGRLKILDFGLAKAVPADDGQTLAATVVGETMPGTVLGTVRYMSPEQVRGVEADPRSDLFSFGVVLFEMLAGRPAFERDSAVEVMNAILKEDPPELADLEIEIPASVERILRRCLEKAPEQRFQSARDLAFALRNSTGSTSRVSTGVQTTLAVPPKKRGPWAMALLSVVLGIAIGAAGAARFLRPPPSEPMKVWPLSHSGQDVNPSASPDGNMIAFTSSRGGRQRIWLRQVRGGIEAPLTEGPDQSPRFSPDGSSVLFVRREAGGFSIYRVPVVGGPARKLLEDAYDADWSPDGQRIVFTMFEGTTDQPVSVIGIHDLATGNSHELLRVAEANFYGVRWSPDGRWIAASRTPSVQNARDRTLVRIDAETGQSRALYSGEKAQSSSAWTPDGQGLVFAESMSLLGDLSTSLGRVLRIGVDGENPRTLFWVQSVWAGSSDYVSFDFLDAGHLVFDEILWKGSLTEIPIDGSPPFSRGRRLTEGNSRDRQPAYSPDGRRILFSSNRSGNLDLWTLDLQSGELRQLTDDAADDWDPAFTADGAGILWSSNRSGPLEIWTARADGSGARQLSQDGEDAENPTQTPDGQWVTYGSGNAERNGIWKMRSDGSEATLLARGAIFLPEVSPDGRWVAHVANDGGAAAVNIVVRALDDGEEVFRTVVPFRGFQSMIQPGRPRWLPDGQALIFVAPGANGRNDLVIQDFRPNEDTRATRRALVSFDTDEDIESFGVAPDGRSVTVARIGHMRRLKMAEGDFE